jgi:hypothetical protein
VILNTVFQKRFMNFKDSIPKQPGNSKNVLIT